MYFKSKFGLMAALILVLGMAFNFELAADDWPHWRGPNRNDISSETGLLKSWPEKGPKSLWVFDKAGLGYAGISIVEDRLYTMGFEDNQEFALCLNAASGEEIWRTPIGDGNDSRGGATAKWGDGSRSTPSVDGDRIYFMSVSGSLNCIQNDGSVVWSAKMSDFGGQTPSWGYSESPLVDGDKVVCTPGGKQGSILALDKMTGKKVWQTEPVTRMLEDKPSAPAKAHYSSILPVEIGGKRQYVQLLVLAVVGVDAENGKVLWKSTWPGRTAVIPSPIYDDGKVYVTSGYGVGSKLIDVSGSSAEDVWMSKAMVNHHGGVIKIGDYVYGYSDSKGWVCQDLSNGKMKWNDKKIKKGAVTYADGMFIHVQENDGKVLLIKADENNHEVVSSFTLSPQTKRDRYRGKIWVHPVVANGKLYLRDQDVIICHDISSK